MSCLSRVSSYTAAIVGRTSQVIARYNSYQSSYSTPLWKTSYGHVRAKTVHSEFLLARVSLQCYSSKRITNVKALRKSKPDSLQPKIVEQEKDAFFVVRKGDVVGVYKNFSDCQAQFGFSVCDPPVSVYKGYSLPMESEAYLLSHGLQNALYTIRAADLKENLFGDLVPCEIQEPASSRREIGAKEITKMRSIEALELGTMEMDGSRSVLADCFREHAELDSQDRSSCILEFDGSSRGNPGQAGAGAVLRNDDGSLICRLREGIGIATCNAAEYRGLILGLKYALQKGYKKIRVQGDSKLVCLQIQGLWRAKHKNMSKLHEQATILKNNFMSFEINHVLRAFNSDADAQATMASKLADGQVQAEFE